MIKGVGHDLVEIRRIASAMSKNERFVRRICTEQEWQYCQQKGRPEASLAARFAAKEAASKALGTGIGSVSWQELEIICDPSGRPTLQLKGEAQALAKQMGVTAAYVSLTHTEDYASAVVILEGE